MNDWKQPTSPLTDVGLAYLAIIAFAGAFSGCRLYDEPEIDPDATGPGDVASDGGEVAVDSIAEDVDAGDDVVELDTSDACLPNDGDASDLPPVEPFVWADSRVGPSSIQPVADVLWVGEAAWNDRAGVESELARLVTEGKVPFVQFYYWGEGGGNALPLSEYDQATQEQIDDWIAFGNAVADGIGDGEAYVVMEPNWDTHIDIATSEKFKDPLKQIIANFRNRAPNAQIVISANLVASDSEYAQFDDVASRVDRHGFIHHEVSDNSECTERTSNYNPRHYPGGTDLQGALKIVEDFRRKADRIQGLFGGPVFVSELAITRCGWGDSGQKQIIEKLVDNLPGLYDSYGVRGIHIRTGAPGDEARYRGIKNEGMYDFAGYPAESEVDRGVEVLQNHLQSLQSSRSTSCSSAP